MQSEQNHNYVAVRYVDGDLLFAQVFDLTLEQYQAARSQVYGFELDAETSTPPEYWPLRVVAGYFADIQHCEDGPYPACLLHIAEDWQEWKDATETRDETCAWFNALGMSDAMQAACEREAGKAHILAQETGDGDDSALCEKYTVWPVYRRLAFGGTELVQREKEMRLPLPS